MTQRTIGSVAIQTGLSVRALWLVAVTYASAMALIVLWQSHRWEEFATRAVDELASLFGVLVAAGCAGWAARSARARARRGWLALAAGLLAWAVGEGLWCYQEFWLRAEDAPSMRWPTGFFCFSRSAPARRYFCCRSVTAVSPSPV